MRKIFFLLITLTITTSSIAQKPNITNIGSRDPYSVVTKVLKYSNKIYFEGSAQIGYANGDANFDFSKWSKEFPNVITRATVLSRSVREGGVLRNFRYKNSGPNYTKIILADWINFDKNSGSATFEMSILDERYPNKLYVGLEWYGGSKYYFNIELSPVEFEEIVNILDYSTLSPESTNKLLSKKLSVVNKSSIDMSLEFIEKELDNSENIFFQTVVEEDIYDDRTKLYFHTKDLSKIYKIYIEDLEYTTDNTFAFIISNWEYDSKNNCKNIFYKVNVTVKNNIPIFKLNKISEGICAG
jgi:hypothetical protein